MKKIVNDHWPLLVFLLAVIVATVFSRDFRQSISIQSPLLTGLACYVLIAKYAVTQTQLKHALWAAFFIIFSATLYSAPIVLLSTLDNPLAQIKVQGSAFFVVPNDVLMLSVVAPLLFAVAWTGGWWLRGLTVCVLLLMLVIGENVQSRQAVMLLVVGQIIVVTLMRPHWALPAVLIGGSIGVLVDSMFDWPLASKIFLFPRAYVWQAAWTMFMDRPLVGHGPGLFSDLYFTYLRKAGYVIGELSDRRTMSWSHNLYLEQLAERGVVGFFALLGLLGASLYRAGFAWHQADSDSMRGLSAGILAALIVFIMAGIAEATLIRLWVCVLLLSLAALSSAARKITLLKLVEKSC